MGKILYGAGTNAITYGTFIQFSCTGTAFSAGGTEANVTKIARAAGTFSHLKARITGTGTGRNVKFRKNGANGNGAISFSDGLTDETVEDSSNTDHVDVGDTFCIAVNGSGASNNVNFAHILFEADSGHKIHAFNNSVSSGGQTVNVYWALFGGGALRTVEDDSVQVAMRTSGTVSNFAAHVSTATTNNATFNLRKNSANGNCTVTVSANNTGFFEDTTNSDTFASGDKLGTMLSGQSATSIVSRVSTLIAYDSAINEAMGGSAGLAQSVTNFCGFVTGAVNTTLAEADIKIKPGFNGKIAKLRIGIGQIASGVGNWTLRLRKNGANGNSVVTVTANTNGLFEDTTNTDTFLPTDDLNFSIASGTWSAASISSIQYTITPEQYGQATFPGAGSISAAARLNMRGFATLPGTSTLSTDADLNMRIAATLPGTSGLSALATMSQSIRATFAGAGAMSADATEYGFLRPNADDATGSWTNELGGLPLYPSIDETDPPNDADYIRSRGSPTNDTCKVSLSDPTGRVVSEPFAVSYRYGKTGGTQVDITVTLLQGGTTIKEWTHTDVSSTPTSVRQVLSAGEFASITDLNDLHLQFKANGV